jgi:hypothetical protein
MAGRNLPSPDRADAVLGAMKLAHVPAKFEAERVEIPRRTRMFGDLDALGGCRDRWPTKRGLWY